MLDKDLEQYYESYTDFFVTPGWKQLVELMKTTQEAIESVRTVKDLRDLDYRQGQLAVIDTILNLPLSIELAVNSHQEVVE